MSLAPTEWLESSRIFVEALQHVRDNMARSNVELEAKINEFIVGMVITERPYMLVSSSNFDRTIKMIFGDEKIRDFVLMVGYTFYARWGASQSRFEQLVESIAFAVSADDTSATRSDENLSGIPRDVADIMPDPKDAVEVLGQNKWLVTLLMIQLFVSLPEIPRQTRRSSARGDEAPDPTNRPS